MCTVGIRQFALFDIGQSSRFFRFLLHRALLLSPARWNAAGRAAAAASPPRAAPTSALMTSRASRAAVFSRRASSATEGRFLAPLFPSDDEEGHPGKAPGRPSSRRCAAPAPGAAPASNRLAGPGVDHLGVVAAADYPGLAAGPGGRGRHRGRRPASPLPRRPAAPGQPRVPRGRAQTRRDPRCPGQGSAERKGHQAAGRGHPRLPARGRRRTLATLLTEAAGPLGRRDRAALRTLSGVAPVTKRSGKTRFVVMRHAAQVRLRQAVFHWAGRPC